MVSPTASARSRSRTDPEDIAFGALAGAADVFTEEGGLTSDARLSGDEDASPTEEENAGSTNLSSVYASGETSWSVAGHPSVSSLASSRRRISERLSTEVPGSYRIMSSEAMTLADKLARCGPSGQTAEQLWLAALDAMAQLMILDAETSLKAALRSAEEAKEFELVEEMKRTRLYKEVQNRIAQYDRVGQRLLTFNGEETSKTYEVVWEGVGGDRVYLNMLPGSTYGDVKVSIHMDAPLRECCVPAVEVDLQPKWNKALIKTPQILGVRRGLHQVTQQLVGVLMFRIEAIFEVFRVCNTDFGFFSEMIRSDFPASELGVTIPAVESWRTKRINVDTSNIWIPCGSPDAGTILVQVTRIDLGFVASKKIVKMAINSLAATIVGNLKKQATMSKEPNTVWKERLEKDELGLYAELAKVEAAAAKRRHVTTDRLPDASLFQRASCGVA